MALTTATSTLRVYQFRHDRGPVFSAIDLRVEARQKQRKRILARNFVCGGLFRVITSSHTAFLGCRLFNGG